MLAYLQELADESTVKAAHQLLVSRKEGTDDATEAANAAADDALFYRRMVVELRKLAAPDYSFEGCKVVSVCDTTPEEQF